MAKISKSTKKFLTKSKSKHTSSSKSASKPGGEPRAAKKKGNKQKLSVKKTVEVEVVEEESSEGDDEEETGFDSRNLGDLVQDSSDSDPGSDSQDSEDSDNEQLESEIEEEEEVEDLKLNMDELKDKDPEFYKYLVDNDKELLDFNETDDLDIDEEEDFDDSIVLVTKETIHQWRVSVTKTKSIKTLKKIVMAFRAASTFGDDSPDTTTSLEKYRIADEKVFNLVLLTAIKCTPLVLNSFLYGTSQEEDSKTALPSSNKKWKKVNGIAKSFLSSLSKLLKKMTSLSMTKFVIKNTEKAVPFFACFPKLSKDFLKEILNLWSTSVHEQVRILAFFCIRKLAIVAPNPFLDIALKKSHQVYLSMSRATNSHTWTQIQFMDNCIVELCGLSLASSYQHAFVALRQLAIQLRQASTTKTAENYKAVYNWQFLHAIKLWAHVFTTFNVEMDPKETLKPLIYPLVQIIIGVIRLKPSSKHFPLRLALIKVLVSISAKTGVFIPIVSYLLEVFESAEMKTKPKPSTLKSLDFNLNIRAPNQYLGSKTYHSGLVEQVVGLLYEYYASQAMSIAFPELAIPCIIQFKRIIKNGNDMGISKALQLVVEKLEQNSVFIEKHRSQVSFGPKDIEQSLNFLSDMEKSQAPIYKHYESRLKILAKQTPKEMAVVDENSSDEDDESTVVAEKKVKNAKAPKAKNSRAVTIEGDEDLVEDFMLSDEDEEME